MKTKRFTVFAVSMIAVLAMVVACAPQTVVIEKEVERLVTAVVEIEKEVTKIVAGTPVVEKVVETKVVEVQKEVVVTATPDPAKQKPSVFNGAYPYSVPPQGHFNFFASGFLGVGIYQDLAELPMFFYKWATSEYIPLLGTEYAVEPPDKVRVMLRQGVKWSDGTDFTAEDVVATFALGRLQNFQVWNYVSEVEALDDFTVLFTMGKPALPAVRMILKQRIAPASVYGELAAEAQALFDAGKTRDDQEWKDLQTKLGEFRPEKKVVTGPYTIENLADVNEARLTMVKVPTSFWADKVKFDEVYIYQGETPVITPLVMSQQVDYATHGFAPATEKAFQELGVRILRPPIFSGPAIAFNFKIHPFEMVEFRQAVAHAIDMDENAFVSLGQSAKRQAYMTGVSDNFIVNWLTQAQLDEMNQYEYDVAKAAEILEGIGFTKGADGIWVDDKGTKCEYELIVPAEYADWSGAAENAAAQLTEFGIKTVMRGVTFTQIQDQVNKGDFQLAIRGWGSGDPHPYFSIRASFFNDNPAAQSGGDPNLPGIAYSLQREIDGKSMDLEQMIIDCPTGLDQEEQKGRVYELAKIFNQELPRVPLWERYGNNPVQDGLHTTGWPPDDDALYKNSPYSDSFVILWILDGTIGPIE